jgi:hypothetical protein
MGELRAIPPAAALITTFLAGCATVAPPTEITRAPFERMLLREYDQLAATAPLGRSRFAAKATAVREGRCVQPEQPADWRRSERIIFRIPALGDQPAKSLDAVSARAILMRHLGRAVAASPQTAVSYPDLPVARAHAQGRYDCVLAQGISGRNALGADLCMRELGAAMSYLSVARQSTPDAPVSVCEPTP